MAGVTVAGVGGDEGGRFFGEDDFVVGFAVDVETGDLAGQGVGTVSFQAENLRVVAGLVRDLGIFEDAPRVDPVLRPGEIGVE